MKSKQSASSLRRVFPSPALVVAFVALFAAMGGFGYAAVKMKPNSVKSKNIKAGAVTTDKIADGAVTTPKLSPEAVAPNAVNAMNAANADKLGGVAPGECQQGWLKASAVISTANLTQDRPDGVADGFDCASADPIQIHREATGIYTVTLPGIATGTALSSSSGANPGNQVTAASQVDGAELIVKVWNNGDAQFVDGKTFALVVF